MKIIIIGAGEVGFHIASRLSVENKDVVVIDKDPEAIRRVSDSIDVQVINGSGSSPTVLEEAGLKQAEILLAVTDSDEINLIACLVANVISPATKKLARIRDADFDAYHDTFREKAPHIDTIINPETEVVRTIDRLMGVPGAADVEEFADGRVKFIGVRLDKGSPLDGVRLAELSMKIGKTAPLIAAIVRGAVLTIPRGDDRLMAGDLVYFVTEAENLMDTLAIFEKQVEPVRRVMIVGGGRLGLRLCHLLEEKNIYTKIVEKNPDRCLELAKRLNKVVVLHGDGSNQELLKEEGILDMDLVVTLTDDEKTNILASLLAKRMGARKTITRVTSFSYFDLMEAIGIDQVVSPRLSAINTILKHIRRGKVLSAVSLKGEQAEILEAVAMETSDIVGKPLKKISFPKGVLVTVIIRADRVIIPSGTSIIEPGDRVIIFASRQAVPKIEKFMAVKLEYF
ncbi:MAG: Trk system potassium transporter TrkA [Thermodesulfobacteriota bacterium]